MFAGRGADSGVYFAVLGVAVVGGNARCAVDWLDSRFVASRSVLHLAGADGCFHVPANAVESHAAGSDSSQDDDVHAAGVLGHVLLLPVRTGFVLRSVQRAFNSPAVLHHANDGPEESGESLTFF